MKTFNLNDKIKTKPNDRYWTFCVGSGHAALALRKDYLEQLKRAHDELGFERVRFHGIFDDDMKVITRLSDYISLIPSSKKVKTTSFYHIALVFDELLKIGIKPFVEVGFMPSALAKGKRKLFYYKANITMPKYFSEWNCFIKEFIEFLINRYGKDEVESWYFEIWNEPNLNFFFAGNQSDYFTLYKETVNAIKSVDSNLKVGGPATSENKWLPEMKQFCKDNNVPLDFLSTHHYPGDDLGLPLFTKENISRYVLTAKKNKGETVHKVINKMLYQQSKLPLIKKDSMVKQAQKANEEAGDIPLFYTEWNVNPSCTAPVHDTTQSASYIVKHVMDCQYLMDGCSFWTFSDIFEELTFFTQPFSGSFGLMNVNGIPKPSYWAFYLLNRLEKERFLLPTTHDNIEMSAFKSEDGKKIQFIVYNQNYCEGSCEKQEVNIEYETDNAVKSASVMKIDNDHCNPLKIWKDMGSPEYLSENQVNEIKEKSKLVSEKIEFTCDNGKVNITTQLADNNIQLIELELE